MKFSFITATLLAVLARTWAYEVATNNCCESQLDYCHQQGANACMWTNVAVCVDNPKNRVPVVDTCLTECPTKTVKNPNGFIYKFQKHNVTDFECVCGDLNPNLSNYCQG
ncbi:hypothetical protein LX32DRAFT_652076 [Colletotrichum zoysiae]|uniref:Uncharacterized protein n=1 Tax=Colletotrichum zoysiae TaxID=1216348 RepID=A0AAD9HK81_9PEZI|nr:hypothetical protein LX32DRAFT_652076 [Colletotrichum zoysiae]